MHQNRLPAGGHPGELIALPRPPNWLYGQAAAGGKEREEGCRFSLQKLQFSLMPRGVE
jgi:hypothetical protein